MVRTQVILSEDHYRFLKKLSFDSGRSMSDLVREAIDRMRRAEDDRKEKMLSLLGAFEADRDDVSEQHDHYLASALEGDE